MVIVFFLEVQKGVFRSRTCFPYIARLRDPAILGWGVPSGCWPLLLQAIPSQGSDLSPDSIFLPNMVGSRSRRLGGAMQVSSPQESPFLGCGFLLPPPISPVLARKAQEEGAGTWLSGSPGPRSRVRAPQPLCLGGRDSHSKSANGFGSQSLKGMEGFHQNSICLPLIFLWYIRMHKILKEEFIHDIKKEEICLFSQ